ncbi:hypothetical protein Rhal01_00558 [Rubritalea halochordaticola]|uniref:Tetracyclin repressor-like C-terminal domain-containing protein n=1 Tax=Rubritalea halochordaticola TaxID=714537 RepID=A0ABP9UVK5_9BACT
MSEESVVLDKKGIEDAYWRYLLTEGKRPASVFAFCEHVGLDEGGFYESYAGFEAIEASYWKRLIEETLEVLEKDEDYAEYPAEQKLLAFFYTYFAHVQKHRSRLVSYFPRPGLAGMKVLQPMRNRFLEYAKGIVSEGLSEGTLADRKKLTEYYDRMMFEHFRVIIEYYRNDQSEGFADTDAFIEKTVRLAVDGARAGVLDSALDLARFMMRKLPSAK